MPKIPQSGLLRLVFYSAPMCHSWYTFIFPSYFHFKAATSLIQRFAALLPVFERADRFQYSTSFLNLGNSANALYILLRTVISLYLHCINAFVLSGLFHYPDRFLHHLVRKNKGRMYTVLLTMTFIPLLTYAFLQLSHFVSISALLFSHKAGLNKA